MAKGDTTQVERDLKSLNGPVETKGMHYRDGTKGVATPYDVPVYVRCHEIQEETENHKPAKRSFSKGIKAQVMELDYFTFGVKVLVRNTFDGSLKVYVQDSEGTSLVADYSKE